MKFLLTVELIDLLATDDVTSVIACFYSDPSSSFTLSSEFLKSNVYWALSLISSYFLFVTTGWRKGC